MIRLKRSISKEVTLVALGKYPIIFNDFVNNVTLFAPDHKKVLVRDQFHIACPRDWVLVQGPEQFSMAGNANLGWKAVDPTHDIFYIGDDCRLLDFGTIEKLRQVAYSDASIGMVSPKIIGGANNPLQTNPPMDREVVYTDQHLALVCTYIKRELINAIGYLDDVTFVGYGYDDVDYSYRAKKAGFKLAIAPQVSVQHGVRKMDNGETRKGTETFIINHDGEYDPIQAQCEANERAFKKKWGIS